MGAYVIVSLLSFCAGVGLCAAMLRPRENYRRPGYVKLPASSTTRAATAARAAISFSSSPRLGLASAVEVGPVTPPAPNSTLVRLPFGSVKVGDPGQPPASADSDDVPYGYPINILRGWHGCPRAPDDPAA